MEDHRLKAARDFLVSQPRMSRPPTKEEHARVCLWVDELIAHEKRSCIKSLESQLAWFQMFSDAVSSTGDGVTYSFAAWALYRWARLTNNKFGIAYSLGHNNGHTVGSYYTTERSKLKRKKSATKAVNNATKGRRLIGETTKERIRRAAKEHMHQSKTDAAPEIARKVGLSSGRVQRLLSVIFPGDTWVASSDVASRNS